MVQLSLIKKTFLAFQTVKDIPKQHGKRRKGRKVVLTQIDEIRQRYLFAYARCICNLLSGLAILENNKLKGFK